MKMARLVGVTPAIEYHESEVGDDEISNYVPIDHHNNNSSRSSSSSKSSTLFLFFLTKALSHLLWH